MGRSQLLIWEECTYLSFPFPRTICERAKTDKDNRTSIERDHKQIQVCKKGQPSVAVKIEGPNQPMYGRHLEEKETLYSHISRQSIDTLKEFFREDVSMDEWKLITKLKPVFDVAWMIGVKSDGSTLSFYAQIWLMKMKKVQNTAGVLRSF